MSCETSSGARFSRFCALHSPAFIGSSWHHRARNAAGCLCSSTRLARALASELPLGQAANVSVQWPWDSWRACIVSGPLLGRRCPLGDPEGITRPEKMELSSKFEQSQHALPNAAEVRFKICSAGEFCRLEICEDTASESPGDVSCPSWDLEGSRTDPPRGPSKHAATAAATAAASASARACFIRLSSEEVGLLSREKNPERMSNAHFAGS